MRRDDGETLATVTIDMQMNPTTPFPYYLPVSAEGKGDDTPGRDVPSPRRHDMRHWLHDDHQQHSTFDGTTPMNKMPPHLNTITTPGGQPPPPPLLKKQRPPSKPQPPHRKEQQEGQQQQQKQHASEFIAAFLLDAASVTVPTKMSEHDTSSYGVKKKSSKKRQQRLMRQNIYGSARSHDSANISRSSSIDSLSGCLDVLARSSTKNEQNAGKKVKIKTILTKTKQSGSTSKQGCHHLSSNSSRCSVDSDDDLSLVSTFSDWNELIEKTFGCDDPPSETNDFLLDLDLDKHLPVTQNIGEEKSCCDEGRDDSRHQVGVGDPTMTASAPKTSTPMATPPTPKPILKVKESHAHTMAADTDTERSGVDVHDYFEELISLDNSIKTSCNDSASKDSIRTTDSDLERFLTETLRNDTDKRRNTKQKRNERKRLSSSMGDIFDMMEGIFTGDEIAEDHSFEFEQQKQKRSDTSERARRVDRLRKKKAAMHTRALHDSVQSKPTALSPHKPRPRNNSYDDAERFLSSLEEASAALSKSKMSDNAHCDQREAGIHFSASRSKAVHQSRDRDVKSLDAFDGMLAEIEEEERRMESALFGSKPKSGQGLGEHLPEKSYKRGETTQSSCSYSHIQSSTCPTKVICLKWVDRRGMVGHFTGEVNSMIQPHGRGTLVYENGLVLDCNWCNGSPSTSAAASTSPKKHAANADENRSNQFHPDYDLGMPARSRHDMKEEDPDKAMKGISRLKKLDFAFVRRSNKQWTYSIISDRTDDCIRFVVDEVGRTKRIGRDDWLKNIRRIRVHHKHEHHDHADGHKKSPRRRRTASIPRRKKLEP